MRTRDPGRGSGRRAHPWVRSGTQVLGIFLATALPLSACIGQQKRQDVGLADIVREQHQFLGAEVRTQGTVRRFVDASGPYFVLEDSEQDRVELLPASLIMPFLGARIAVDGRFGFDDHEGRFIRVERVTVMAARPSSISSAMTPARVSTSWEVAQ